MFNKLLKYLKNDEYLISFSSDYIHFYNFNSIKTISDNTLELQLKDKNICVTGSDFSVIKMEKKELLLKGNVEKVEVK